MSQVHQQSFGHVRVEWRCGEQALVKLWWRGSLFLAEMLDAGRPWVPFSVAAAEDGAAIRISGALRYAALGSERCALWLSLRYPGGELNEEALCPAGAPPPVPPPLPEPAELQVVAAADDLFSYIYLRPWPELGQAELENRFIGYDAASAAADSLYAALVAARTANDRATMVQAALDFVAGRPPYAGVYVADVRRLDGVIAQFAELDRLLLAQAHLTLDELRRQATRLCGLTWSELLQQLTTADYAVALERVWQSFFALQVLLRYAPRNLAQLTLVLRVARLLSRIAATEATEALDADPPAADVAAPDEPQAGCWPSCRLQQGVRATVILPQAIFPLPPQSSEAQTADPDDAQILPYAIGDLEVVRQCLIGYELGEVCRVDNLMRGEIQQDSQRNVDELDTGEGLDERSTQLREQAGASAADELQQAVHRTLTETLKLEASASYGPPTEGSTRHTLLQIDPVDGPQQQRMEDAARVAQDLTQRSLSRLNSRLRRERRIQQSRRSERRTLHRLDGSQLDRHARGIYRWVNKCHQLHVERYGRRLIVEILLQAPARHYISAEQSLRGRSLVEPVAPALLGLDNFTALSTDADSPLYYAALAARYAADDVEPPPAERLYRSLSLFSVPVPAQATLDIVPGYVAVHADIGLLATPATAGSRAVQVSGFVGSTAFSLAADGASLRLELPQESGALPIVAGPSSAADAASDGATGQASTPGAFALAIGVTLKLGDAEFRRWQQTSYRQLMAAYQRQRAAYDRAAGVDPAAPDNPLGQRQRILRSLQQDVRGALVARVRQQLGATPELPIDEVRYEHFFEQAFEWAEMSFGFVLQTGSSPAWQATSEVSGELPLLTAFLQARSARVLLPVNPRHEFAAALFLASAELWPVEDELAPVCGPQLALINELKDPALADAAPRRSQPWRLRTPTTMVYLQDDEALPWATPGRPADRR